jgi:hypothetical protein
MSNEKQEVTLYMAPSLGRAGSRALPSVKGSLSTFTVDRRSGATSRVA